MIILDSDILIWVLRKNEEIKEKLIKATVETDGSLYITPIQIAEIYAGMRKSEIPYNICCKIKTGGSLKRVNVWRSNQ